MVDFSEALKARIESMSPDELAATEVRRQSREAGQTQLTTLEALWEPVSSGKGSAETKEVTVRIDAGSPQGSADNLKILQGSTFHESIILLPSVYRLIAGGTEGLASPKNSPPPDRFVINAGAPGYDRITVDRAALAALVAQERPLDMARARRLLDDERRAPASAHLPSHKLAALFEARWDAESTSIRIESAVSKVPSRALLLLAGKDHVALWVRREDLTVGPGRILGSPLAGAIVRPEGEYTRKSAPGPGGVSGDPNAQYLRNTFGSGPERTLVLDVGRVGKLVAALPRDGRDLALALFDRLIDRSAALGRERAAKGIASSPAASVIRGRGHV